MKNILTFILFLISSLCFAGETEFYNLKLVDVKTNKSEILTFNSETENNLVFEKLRYKANIRKTVKNHYNSFCIDLENISEEKDRALTASVLISTEETGWTWHYDVTQKTVCEKGKTYFECDYYSEDEPSYNPWVIDLNGRPQSVVPVSVISKKDRSFVWGYFLDTPGVYRMKFTEHNIGGTLEFQADLGFSDYTKTPNKSNFTFFIEETDKETDYRHALKEYYTKCPQYFEDRNVLGKSREHGAWTLWMLSNVLAPWDFQIAYNQIQMSKEDVAQGKAQNWQRPLTSYTEPWGYYQMFPPKEGFSKTEANLDLHQVSTEDMLRMLKKGSQADPSLIDTYIMNVTQKECASVALKTAVYRNPQGDLCSYKWQPCCNMRNMTREEETELWGYPYFYSMILVNPDPDIPGFNRYDLSMKECDLDTFDGYQLDSLADFGTHQDNYRKEHWLYGDIPLTFGADTKEPAQPHYWNCLEYLYKLREHADSQNRTIASNTWMPFITFSAPYLDYIGAGESDCTQYPVRWYYAMRSLVPYKNLSYLDYSIQMNDTDNIDIDYSKSFFSKDKNYKFNRIEEKMEKMLLFACWPGTGNGWHFSDKVEKIRPYYRKYMPLYKLLSEAGYEPVQNAETDRASCLIERYGNYEKNNLCFAVRNTDINPDNIKIKVSAPKNALF
ncbi:MAG: hypothetical protein KBT47_08425, partial [Armatimonadetes bacterium]|nr:hypothetical protein [Candidatus Hippobium faecium]